MIEARFDGHVFVVSDRLVNVLLDNNITGWKTYPIIVYDKKGTAINGYHGFTVSGRGGTMLAPMDERGNIIGHPECIVWDSCQWDGTDIFWIKPNYVVVTERVKDVLKEARIDSLSFDRLDSHRIQII